MLTKQEIRQLSDRDLQEELLKTRRELLKTQLNFRSGHNKESHTIRNHRRYIAQLKTIKREMIKTGAQQAKEMITKETNSAPKKKKGASSKK